MKNIAQVVLDGNLTADPEIKKTLTDKLVTRFSVAANHEWAGKEGKKMVSYFPIECWERLAENCNQYLHKGSRVTIQGELREDRWVDQEGKKQSQLKIVARSVRFDSFPKKENKSDDREKENESDDSENVEQ